VWQGGRVAGWQCVTVCDSGSDSGGGSGGGSGGVWQCVSVAVTVCGRVAGWQCVTVCGRVAVRDSV
jgi:hypothetical protein